MKIGLKQIHISKNMKSVLQISGGTLIGQLINIISIPIFARFYGAQIIGGWAFLNTIALIVFAVSDLGLTEALMVETNETHLNQTYRVVSTLVCLAGIVSAFVMYLYLQLVPKANNSSVFSSVFLALAIITLKQTQVCYTYLNREGKYGVLMKNPVIQNVSFAVVGTGLAIVGLKAYGYYIGWFFAQCVTLLHMRRFMPRSFLSFRFSDYKDVVVRNKRNVTYQWPNNVFLRFTEQLPALLIRQLFGMVALGQYSITMRGLNIPINLLGMAIGRVFFKNISEMKREGKPIGDFALCNILRAMKIGVLPIVAIMSVSDIAIDIFLGDGWQMAGVIIRILAIYAYFLFLNLSMLGLAVSLEKQNYALVSSLAQLVAIFAAFYVGYYFFDSIYVSMACLAFVFAIIITIYISALFQTMQIGTKKYVGNVVLHMAIIFVGYLLIRIPLLLLGIVSTP